ncbi:MAG: hypothetical protein WCW30_03505, partial [Candidatus Gracilibacteria bacterium]
MNAVSQGLGEEIPHILVQNLNPEERFFLSLKQQKLWHFFSLSGDQILNEQWEAILTFRKYSDNLDAYIPYVIQIDLNGIPINTFSSEEWSDSTWTAKTIPLSSEYLKTGSNLLSLTLDKDLNQNYLNLILFNISQEETNQRACLSQDGGSMWGCLPEGQTYSINIQKTQDLSLLVPTEWESLLDKQKYGILRCDIDHAAWGPENAYFVNLLNEDEIKALKTIPVEGENDYEKAKNLMEYLYQKYSQDYHYEQNFPNPTEEGRKVPVNLYTNNIYEYLFAQKEEDYHLSCSALAYSFVGLLYLNGIDGRVVQVENGKGTGHTTSEAYIDGKWVLLDPYAGLIFDNEGEHYGIKDITEHFEVFKYYLETEKPY